VAESKIRVLGPKEWDGAAEDEYAEATSAETTSPQTTAPPSVAVHSSEKVALRHPIMPVGNGLGGRVVGINSHQL
jgi:hypothetical protein